MSGADRPYHESRLARLYVGDVLDVLSSLEDESVDLILTDPPYFLDKLDSSWNPNAPRTKNQVVNHLPAGMAFSPRQPAELHEFYLLVAGTSYQKLKPGAWFVSFSSPRLAHAIARAKEEAGLWIRDVLTWDKGRGFHKGFSLARFAQTQEERELLSRAITPQTDGRAELIVVAQKPPEGPLYKNYLKYGVGLWRERVSSILSFPPTKRVFEKPVPMLRLFIRAMTPDNGLVVDPFLGSGSTAEAALLEGRRFIGGDLEEKRVEETAMRLKRLTKEA